MGGARHAAGVVAAAALLGGCEEPEVRAWHGAVDVRSMRQGEGGCDVPLVEVEPPEPYLFVAVDTHGIEDLATLYWCPEPKDCGPHFDGGYLTRLTERRLEASAVIPQHDLGLCNARWSEIRAEQDEEGHVSLTYRGGEGIGVEMSETDCAEYAADVAGASCDLVFAVEGRR